MLSTLGLGLAAGVGAFALVVFATLVQLVLLALVEMHVPQPLVRYKPRVSTGAPTLVRPAVGSSITAGSIGSGGSQARF